ncbi:16S rRNA (cytidine(1402)-2'-O)-methyltransferase [Chloroflexota bacterium]
MPSLYVVATPIGNLEDISLRALRVLAEVSLIAAEDTRKTRKLLNRYSIKTALTSYHEHNKLSKLDYLMEYLQEKDVALVSEAGTPGVSDPGYELIAASGQRGIPVVPIPGPSAIITALTVSGLPTDRFTYLGFLPPRQSARRSLLQGGAAEKSTLILLEAPHRLIASLQDILQILGDRRIAVCRELTKLHEDIFRGTVSQAVTAFREPRGEFTLVIEGRQGNGKPQMTEEVAHKLHDLYCSGATAKEAIARFTAETGLPRKELYRAWLKFNAEAAPEDDSRHHLERR